jgi:hypothetical protein
MFDDLRNFVFFAPKNAKEMTGSEHMLSIVALLRSTLHGLSLPTTTILRKVGTAAVTHPITHIENRVMQDVPVPTSPQNASTVSCHPQKTMGLLPFPPVLSSYDVLFLLRPVSQGVLFGGLVFTLGVSTL